MLTRSSASTVRHQPATHSEVIDWRDMAACKDYKFEKGEPDPWFPTSEAPDRCGGRPAHLRNLPGIAHLQGLRIHGEYPARHLGGMTAKERINQVRRQRRPRQTKPKGKKPCSS
ncbi:hypothetical protein ATC04_00040 [Arthrobacter sp. YC-RL1]|nr:hypothetical protein [Arthrobacter sp. YC-RL1]ALQ29093.1 hypothetical protein ATC04_00040 [Arthrobacter sp. YC-RL1]